MTAEALGVLNVGVNHVNSTPPGSRTEQVLKQYPGITDGIGCLKGVTVKLHIDSSVPPVARKHSRVPFHFRDKVAQEIDKLLKADIIEKVKGPTEWVSASSRLQSRKIQMR